MAHILVTEQRFTEFAPHLIRETSEQMKGTLGDCNNKIKPIHFEPLDSPNEFCAAGSDNS